MPKYGHKERWFTKSCQFVSCAMGTKSMVWNVSSFYVVDFGPVFWKFLFCLHFPVSSSFFSVWHKTGEFAGLWYSELPWCACEQSYKPVTANIMVIPLPRWVTGTISPYPEKRACCKGARASLIPKMSLNLSHWPIVVATVKQNLTVLQNLHVSDQSPIPPSFCLSSSSW